MSNNDCCVRIRDVDAGMRHTQHLTLEWPVNFTGHAPPPPPARPRPATGEAGARPARSAVRAGAVCCGACGRGVRQRRGDDGRRGRAKGPELVPRP